MELLPDDDCDPPNWPKPPIWPEDLPLIRQLLTEDEYQHLLKRLIHCLPDGPLVRLYLTVQQAEIDIWVADVEVER